MVACGANKISGCRKVMLKCCCDWQCQDENTKRRHRIAPRKCHPKKKSIKLKANPSIQPIRDVYRKLVASRSRNIQDISIPNFQQKHSATPPKTPNNYFRINSPDASISEPANMLGLSSACKIYQQNKLLQLKEDFPQPGA